MTGTPTASLQSIGLPVGTFSGGFGHQILLYITAGRPRDSTLLYALLLGSLSNLRRTVLDPDDVPINLHAVDAEE